MEVSAAPRRARRRHGSRRSDLDLARAILGLGAPLAGPGLRRGPVRGRRSRAGRERTAGHSVRAPDRAFAAPESSLAPGGGSARARALRGDGREARSTKCRCRAFPVHSARAPPARVVCAPAPDALLPGMRLAHRSGLRTPPRPAEQLRAFLARTRGLRGGRRVPAGSGGAALRGGRLHRAPVHADHPDRALLGGARRSCTETAPVRHPAGRRRSVSREHADPGPALRGRRGSRGAAGLCRGHPVARVDRGSSRRPGPRAPGVRAAARPVVDLQVDGFWNAHLGPDAIRDLGRNRRPQLVLPAPPSDRARGADRSGGGLGPGREDRVQRARPAPGLRERAAGAVGRRPGAVADRGPRLSRAGGRRGTDPGSSRGVRAPGGDRDSLDPLPVPRAHRTRDRGHPRPLGSDRTPRPAGRRRAIDCLVRKRRTCPTLGACPVDRGGLDRARMGRVADLEGECRGSLDLRSSRPPRRRDDARSDRAPGAGSAAGRAGDEQPRPEPGLVFAAPGRAPGARPRGCRGLPAPLAVPARTAGLPGCGPRLAGLARAARTARRDRRQRRVERPSFAALAHRGRLPRGLAGAGSGATGARRGRTGCHPRISASGRCAA